MTRWLDRIQYKWLIVFGIPLTKFLVADINVETILSGDVIFVKVSIGKDGKIASELRGRHGIQLELYSLDNHGRKRQGG